MKEIGLIKNKDLVASDFYQIFYLYYNKLYLDKGLVGIYQTRKSRNKGFELLEYTLQQENTKLNSDSLPYHSIIKDYTKNIRLTLEIFRTVAPLLKLFSNLAFLPIISIWICSIIRKLMILFSLLLSFTFAALSYTEQPLPNAKIFWWSLGENLRISNLNWHNYIFHDNIPLYPVSPEMLELIAIIQQHTVIPKPSIINSYIINPSIAIWNYSLFKINQTYSYIIPQDGLSTTTTITIVMALTIMGSYITYNYSDEVYDGLKWIYLKVKIYGFSKIIFRSKDTDLTDGLGPGTTDIEEEIIVEDQRTANKFQDTTPILPQIKIDNTSIESQSSNEFDHDTPRPNKSPLPNSPIEGISNNTLPIDPNMPLPPTPGWGDKRFAPISTNTRNTKSGIPSSS